MAIKNPFKSVLKSNRQSKITPEEELTFWNDTQDTMNNLISRFNSAASSSISQITFRTITTLEAPLNKDDYDYNINKFENAANAMINLGGPLGFNSLNQIVLHKTSDFELPLTTSHRDSNCGTIQIFINTSQQLFSAFGI